MDSTGPVRQQSDLAEMVELLLEKGVVINADIVVSIGDTELLGVELRAALASFETAAKYGLEFPEGTDRQRVVEAAGEPRAELSDRAREELPGGADDEERGRARSLRTSPAGPPSFGGDGGDGGDSDEEASSPEAGERSGTSEADRRTPAGADEVTIDPAPYEPGRPDRDPDVDDPGVDHPRVDVPDDDEAETDESETDTDTETDASETDESSDEDGEGDGS